MKPIPTTSASDPASAAGLAFRREADAWLELPQARCGLWWSHVPSHPTERLGCIGAWQADDRREAALLLDAACDALREAGATLAVGPMDGNTWRSHRFVIESDGRPPYFLEPTNPPEAPDDFRAAGFGELSRYSSSEIDLLAPQPDFADTEARLAREGVVLGPLRMDRFEDELRALHETSLVGFRNNFLYTDLAWEEFHALYAAVESLLVPGLARMAWCGDVLAGFLFTLPDRLAPAGTAPAAILKSLTVRPEKRFAGLGSVLTKDCHLRARELGFVKAIHALQREGNTVLRLSERFGARVFRRYALFGKPLLHLPR